MCASCRLPPVEKMLADPTPRRLTLGCSVLDRAMGGGLLTRGITEVFGESGVGKTQLCLQLCLTAQLPVAEGTITNK